ncbi:P80 family lipoprotein [Mycoplasma enhydrae]|uniref:P68 family surface lipoprotein n=1 Tax=Mycoplasma enhydrae TaxID=2499220 RepID=UPI0021E74B0A|nr:P80 family lipoprotein [Mycoplasma enhydrae]MCV3753466.1 P80 family lipoprotein [Mycoplasma enhydrae]
MKKINKILLSLTPVSAMAIPLMAAACGRRFDQNYDGIIKIATGYGENNPQGKAMKGIVQAYNDWLESGTEEDKKKRKEDGYLKVEVEFLPNGYNTGPLQSKLNAKERNKFWNIIINYPTAAAIISKRDMNLSISDEDYNALKILDTFKNANDDIAGNDKKEKWVIPFSRSSEMSAIDKVLLGKLIKELKAIDGVNYTQDAVKTKKIDEYVKYYEDLSKAATPNDAKYVDTEWEISKTVELDKAKEAIKKLNITLEDEMFSKYDSLVDFAIAAKKLYSGKDSNNKYIIGLDSLPSALNVMNAAITKGDKSKQYIPPSEKHKRFGGYDYESFLKKNTDQNKHFESMLGKVFEGIKTGAIWIGGGGAYGSSSLTRHNMAISIGSTAGFTHTFVKGNDKTIYFLKTNKAKRELGTPNEIKEPTKQPNKDKGALFEFGKYLNPIFAYDSNVKMGQYDKKFIDKKAQDQFIKHKDKFGDYHLLDAEFNKNESTLKYKGEEDKLTADEISKIIDLGAIFENDSRKYILISKDLYTSEKISKEKLVNKEDADWISAPLRKSASDKKSVFVQGPSLVLIHANEKEDKATKLLVKWLFEHKHTKVTIDKKDYANINSVDAFNQHGNYISPTEAYFSDANKTVIDKLSEAEKLAFQNFKLVKESPSEYQTADDVSSNLSDQLRDSIRAAAVKIVGQVSANKNPSFEDLMEEIRKQFK